MRPETAPTGSLFSSAAASCVGLDQRGDRRNPRRLLARRGLCRLDRRDFRDFVRFERRHLLARRIGITGRQPFACSPSVPANWPERSSEPIRSAVDPRGRRPRLKTRLFLFFSQLAGIWPFRRPVPQTASGTTRAVTVSPPQRSFDAIGVIALVRGRSFICGRSFIKLWFGAFIPTGRENQPRCNLAFCFNCVRFFSVTRGVNRQGS
jgi:hypothetical protein